MQRIPETLIMLSLALLSLALAACTPDGGNSPMTPSGSGGGVSPAIYNPGNDQPADPAAPDVSQPGGSPEGMVAFDGNLFVASTELLPDQWRMAGWRIADQPIDTETQTAPPDCTLYPHLGVADQWVGSCSGHVLVPRAGATNIAVILTNPDGSTTMVQVAPPPNSP